MSSQRAPLGRTGPDHHVRRRRDAAVQRTRSITRTIAVASVSAVAVFAVYVSRALPGHAATTTGTTAGSTNGVTAGGGSSAGGSPSNLATPSSPPVQQQQQQQQQAPVVSGSS
ncbi:MAG TPA: hypothetical protein VII46_04670 [Acidimicrobiales bacterium]